MKTILATFFVILPSIYFWYRTKAEYEENMEITFGNILVVTLILIYSLLIVTYGASWVDGTESYSSYNYSYKRFTTFFMFPGISAGIILFPKISVEYSNFYIPLLRANSLTAFKYIGWLLLIISIISSLAWRGI